MPLQLQTAQVNGRSMILATSATRDVLEPDGLCRFLKKHYPDIYRSVWLEIEPVNGKQFVIPEDAST